MITISPLSNDATAYLKAPFVPLADYYGINDSALRAIENQVWAGHTALHNGRDDLAIELWKAASIQRKRRARELGLAEFKTVTLSGRWVQNIGHFVYVDALLKLASLGCVEDVDKVVLYVNMYRGNRISNRVLLDLYRPHLGVVGDGVGDLSDDVRQVAHWMRSDLDYVSLADNDFVDPWELVVRANDIWKGLRRKPLVSLSQEIADRGRAFCERMNIAKNGWFAVIHARAPGYNGGSQCVRDVELTGYEPIIEKILALGGGVVRLGGAHMPTMSHPHVFDYAGFAQKDPALDIYLASQCRFFIGCSSGLEVVPFLFGVPSLWLNSAPIGDSPWSEDIFYAPKKFHHSGSGAIASLDDIVNASLAHSQFASTYTDKGFGIHQLSDREMESAFDFFFRHAVMKEALGEDSRRITGAFRAKCEALGLRQRGTAIPSAVKHLI